MAQDSKPATTAKATEPDEDDSNFHYYSGGEVKELAGTRVAPVLWWFYVSLVALLLIVAVSYFTGHRTVTGLNRPPGLSASEQAQMQGDLNADSANRGFMTADQLDISRIPLPAGQTLEVAIDKGADVYQTYCFGCHGPNQDGNGVDAASLNPKPRNLRDAPFMQAMTYQRIYTSVHKGVPGTAMPRWENSLTEDQMKDAIAYVLSLSAPKPSADSAAPTADATATPAQAATDATPSTAAPVTGTAPSSANTAAPVGAPAPTAAPTATSSGVDNAAPKPSTTGAPKTTAP